nr:hypothetical protein [uncultured Methanoregula sp.]
MKSIDKNLGLGFFVDPYYMASEYFLEPFYAFEVRFGSLQRFYECNKRWINEYFHYENFCYNRLETHPITGAEELDYYGDMIASDKEYMELHFYFSILTIQCSMLENVLKEISLIISEEQKISKKLSRNKTSVINQYLNFLQISCGLEIEPNLETLNNLDKIRKVRNHFVHNLGENLSDSIKDQFFFDLNENEDLLLNDDFVHFSFITISDLVKSIELAYWKSHNKEPSF